MALPSRNRKLSLDEAWKHYWSVLFPGGQGWQQDLDAEIRQRLYFPAETKGFLSTAETATRVPTWTSDLEIDIQGNIVSGKFQGSLMGNAPLFVVSQYKVLGNWKTTNPIGTTGQLTRRVRDDRRDILTAAVRDCGKTIRNRLLALLLKTDPPIFDIYCKPNGNVFAKERKLPIDGVAPIIAIDINGNRLTCSPEKSVFF